MRKYERKYLRKKLKKLKKKDTHTHINKYLFPISYKELYRPFEFNFKKYSYIFPPV